MVAVMLQSMTPVCRYRDRLYIASNPRCAGPKSDDVYTNEVKGGLRGLDSVRSTLQSRQNRFFQFSGSQW